MKKSVVAAGLRKAAERVASGREEYSCIAADEFGVHYDYNLFAPECHFRTWHFEYALGTKDFSACNMQLKEARHERVMMLLFAACFYETEGDLA